MQRIVLPLAFVALTLAAPPLAAKLVVMHGFADYGSALLWVQAEAPGTIEITWTVDGDSRERGNCGLASLIGRGRIHSDPHGHPHVDLRVLLRRLDAGLSVVSCRRRERRNAGEPE